MAEELKQTGKVTPAYYESASIMFTDVEGFTKISKVLTAEALLEELDCCFNAFDRITEKFKLEKIKTMGDCYMCVGGVPHKTPNHALDSVLAAYEFLQFVENRKIERQAKNLPFFTIRVGINSGDLIAGAIGKKKTTFDIWGDNVNLAARMEGLGVPGRINISQSTYNLIKDKFICTYRGEVEAKNLGKVCMYLVESIKPEFAMFGDNWTPNKKFYDLKIMTLDNLNC